MKLKNSTAVCLILTLIWLAGCSPHPVRSELYFGTSRQAQPDVSPQQWQQFVDEIITPRFPDGLTILEGAGQWRMSDGSLAKEKTHIVIIVHPGTADAQQKLNEIRDEYKKRFSQEAVLEIDEDARMNL
jgi:hypothetical protein